MLTLSFNLLEQKLEEHMSPVLGFFFWVFSLAILSAWNLDSKRDIWKRETILWRCKTMRPQAHSIRLFLQKFQKLAIFGPISLQPLIKKLSKVINGFKLIIFYKFLKTLNLILNNWNMVFPWKMFIEQNTKKFYWSCPLIDFSINC